MRYSGGFSFFFFFYFSHIFYGIKHTAGKPNKVKFCIQQKQVTELYTVALPIRKNAYLIQTKALRTANQLPFLSVICIKRAV